MYHLVPTRGLGSLAMATAFSQEENDKTLHRATRMIERILRIKIGIIGYEMIQGLAFLVEEFRDESEAAEDVDDDEHKAMYRQQGCFLLTVQRYGQVVRRVCTTKCAMPFYLYRMRRRGALFLPYS